MLWGHPLSSVAFEPGQVPEILSESTKERIPAHERTAQVLGPRKSLQQRSSGSSGQGVFQERLVLGGKMMKGNHGRVSSTDLVSCGFCSVDKSWHDTWATYFPAFVLSELLELSIAYIDQIMITWYQMQDLKYKGYLRLSRPACAETAIRRGLLAIWSEAPWSGTCCG